MIRLYDFEFNLIHIEPRCISTRWILYFNDIGTVEAHFLPGEEAVRYILDNRYLVMEEKGKFAVITGYVLGEDFTVFGRTCNWLLKKRVIRENENLSASADEITRNLVKNAFSDTDSLVLGNTLDISETVDFSKEENTLLFDAVKECLALQKCGHSLEFDVNSKRWVYTNYKRRKNDIIFSSANKNAHSIQIESDLFDLADCGYYEKKITDSDGRESLQTEYFSNENTKSGMYRWESILDGSDESSAEVSLKSKAIKDEVSLNTANIKFGKDYMLGDVVRVQIIKGGLRLDTEKAISGIEILRKSGFESEQPIFEEV